TGDGLVPAVAHLDEREPPRAAGLPVRDDLHLGHRPVLGERLPELVLGGRERHVADVQVLTHGRRASWPLGAGKTASGGTSARGHPTCRPGRGHAISPLLTRR